MHTITVTEIKDFLLSSDGTQATFSLTTKYAGDIAVTIPVSALSVLQVHNDRAPGRVPASPAPASAVPDPAPAQAASGSPPGGIELRMPKKFLLAADAANHGIVALVFDPRTDKEVGYALSPKSAKELAVGLVKNADAILAHKPPKPN